MKKQALCKRIENSLINIYNLRLFAKALCIPSIYTSNRDYDKEREIRERERERERRTDKMLQCKMSSDNIFGKGQENLGEHVEKCLNWMNHGSLHVLDKKRPFFKFSSLDLLT